MIKTNLVYKWHLDKKKEKTFTKKFKIAFKNFFATYSKSELNSEDDSIFTRTLWYAEYHRLPWFFAVLCRELILHSLMAFNEFQ